MCLHLPLAAHMRAFGHVYKWDGHDIWQCVTHTQIRCQRLADGRPNPKELNNQKDDVVVISQHDRNDIFFL